MDRVLYDIHNDLHETHWWFRGRKKIVGTLLRQVWTSKNFGKNSSEKFQSGIDLGTGGGSMLELLREFIQKVQILEPDEKIARALKLKYRGEMKISVSTLEDFNSTKNYQVVSLFDVLEHVEDDVKALEKVCSLLAPGGFIVLTVPAYNFLWSNHDERAHHFRRYTKNGLIQKLVQAGFVVKRATYFNTLLFPLVYIIRFFHKFCPSSNTDFAYGSGIGNQVLYFIFSFERFFMKFFNLPFGVSIFCLAVKK